MTILKFGRILDVPLSANIIDAVLLLLQKEMKTRYVCQKVD